QPSRPGQSEEGVCLDHQRLLSAQRARLATGTKRTRVLHVPAAEPALGTGVRRSVHFDGFGPRWSVEAVATAEVVVVDGVPVAVRAVRENCLHPVRPELPGAPSGDESDRTGAPPAGHEGVGGDAAASLHRLGWPDPMDLVERLVAD